MAGIVMCDRCGNLGKANALGGLIVQTTIPVSGVPPEENIQRELCPDCVGEIIAVIEETPERQPGKPFSTPWRRPEPEPETNDRPAIGQ